jgi:hypothetical protein
VLILLRIWSRIPRINVVHAEADCLDLLAGGMVSVGWTGGGWARGNIREGLLKETIAERSGET